MTEAPNPRSAPDQVPDCSCCCQYPELRKNVKVSTDSKDEKQLMPPNDPIFVNVLKVRTTTYNINNYVLWQVELCVMRTPCIVKSVHHHTR